MRDRHYLEIFAVSLAVILLEISYTRIFSFKLYYYFTYMIIGISLLGLGAGGVLVSVVPALKRASASRVIALSTVMSAVMVFGGYFVIASTSLNALAIARSLGELLKLLLLTACLFGPFLMAGIVIATIFAADPQRINRLYCADLLGAGLGCALAVPLIYFITPPASVMLSGVVFALAGTRAAAAGSTRALRAVAIGVALVLAVFVLRPALLPDVRADPTKTLGAFAPGTSPVVFSRWSSVFRVDVMPHPFSRGTSYMINHDGQLGSVMHAFTGDRSTMMRFDGDIRAFPFRVLKPHPEVLIIGSAGGHEILASLYFDARHVTGIELNPVTVSLLTDRFADFSGHLATNKQVTLINAEGRSYLKQSNGRYDLIWFVAPDSYAAMNAATAGAFVLSESYLYTAEMIAESLDHLTPDGILCAQFGELDFERKPNRTVRYLTTAREALARRGISRENHILVATTPPGIMTASTVLVKRSPFTADEVQRFGEAVREVTGSTARYVSGQAADGVVADAVTLDDVAFGGWLRSYKYNVTPVTDDSPFFWHFARFRDAMSWATGPRDLEDAIGERVQIVLLLFVVVFAGIALFLPFVATRAIWAQIPYKLTAAIYFAALGVGFMFFEVSLIQMVTLFLGYPSYSLSVTLFALLVFAGLGSLASQRYVARRDLSLAVLFSALVVLVAFYQFGLPWVVQRWIGASLATRITIAIVMIAPLGLCLGAFMPIGLATIADVTEHKTEFIAWGWAVNGFFSVISSILSTILAMVIGFKLVLLSALVIYLLGILALRRIPLHAACESRTTAAP